MNNVIEEYYRGIYQHIRGEVNSINSLFQHQGVKGEGNETLLRDLLSRFIPERYGIGTGVIIDRFGKQSKQIDIVIYDKFFYPSLLSLATVHFFPIDIVYATVEVKTILTSGSAKEALANIASVKELSIIPEHFMMAESGGGGVSFVDYAPNHPMGFVFAYNSEAQHGETFKNWFVPTNGVSLLKFPSLIGCLDQGIIVFSNSPQGAVLVYPELEMQAYCKVFSTSEKGDFPIKTINNISVTIDQSRTLLNYILYLNEFLKYRRINPNISFVNQYLSDEMRSHMIF
jgi:hypothetical protein